MYICSLAKGTDSDNVRHSGPDTSVFTQKRCSFQMEKRKINKCNTSHFQISIKYDTINQRQYCQKTIPLKVRIGIHQMRPSAFSTKVLLLMKVGTTVHHIHLQKKTYKKDENLANSPWCLLRMAQNYPLSFKYKQTKSSSMIRCSPRWPSTESQNNSHVHLQLS